VRIVSALALLALLVGCASNGSYGKAGVVETQGPRLAPRAEGDQEVVRNQGADYALVKRPGFNVSAAFSDELATHFSVTVMNTCKEPMRVREERSALWGSDDLATWERIELAAPGSQPALSPLSSFDVMPGEAYGGDIIPGIDLSAVAGGRSFAYYRLDVEVGGELVGLVFERKR